MVRELLSFLPYEEHWKKLNTQFHRELQPSALTTCLKPCALAAARRLLVDLLSSPDDFETHFIQMTARTILSSTYGIDAKLKGDPFVALAERAMKALADMGNPGSVLVDYISALRFLPS